LLVTLAVLSLIGVVAVPMIQQGRDTARRQLCQSHLRQLARALHSYHDAYSRLPPAAVWSTDAMTSLALHRSRRVERITHENWVQLLLPFAGQEELSRRFSAGLPVGDPQQSAARMTPLELMKCPVDPFNRSDNPHTISPPESSDAPLEFARGNYAINGGTHALQFEAPRAASPRGDYGHLLVQSEPRRYELWGNGIAGINRGFSIDEFENGQSTLIALDEVRAGIHPLDPRGVWALGQIGGSVTWAHGIGGDAFAPNHPWSRADDILGCRSLHEAVGTETLLREHMPCVDYVDINQQATARSLHPGGVHAAFLDSSVRMISDRIDPGLWHVIHSRETPSAVLADDFDEKLSVVNFTREAVVSTRPAPVNDTEARTASGGWANSLGMSFVRIPAGEFTMGLPDDRGDGDPLPECPAHPVRLTRAFRLSIHEVTRGQFRSVMEYAPSPRGAGTVPEAASSVPDNFPVTNVTWHEAVEFCRRLETRREEAGRRYRLPTEAEWEYACRGDSTVSRQWSQQRRQGDHSADAAETLSTQAIGPVGSNPVNPFGLHDMRGNVWEWTGDWFDRDYYARSPRDDPQGPAAGYIKVVRGGDWRFTGEPCRIDYPMMPPWKSNPFVGFRVVCEFTDAAAGSVVAD
jgi:formylglycine-generating enzyme required for sulfatase activity